MVALGTKDITKQSSTGEDIAKPKYILNDSTIGKLFEVNSHLIAQRREAVSATRSPTQVASKLIQPYCRSWLLEARQRAFFRATNKNTKAINVSLSGL